MLGSSKTCKVLHRHIAVVSPVILMTTTLGNQRLTAPTLVISSMNSTNPTPPLPESSMHKLSQDSYSTFMII